jgi:hypothetical protein
MEVEMILRKVREGGRPEADAFHSLQHQTVGCNFHRHCFDISVAHLLQ